MRARDVGRKRPNRGDAAVRMRERYQRMRLAGLCVRCGERSDGAARCAACRERQLAYQRDSRRERDSGRPARPVRCTECGDLGHNAQTCEGDGHPASRA